MSVPVLHASSSPLVGRYVPIARLLQSFKQAESGQRRCRTRFVATAGSASPGDA